MKKNYFSMAALASVLLLSACSNDENIPAIDSEVTAENELTITLNPGGDLTETRAARPVGSSAAANNVTKVDLAIFTSTDGTTWTVAGTDILSTTSLDWNVGPNDEGTSTTDRYASMKVKVKNLVAGTQYKIVAYGYDTTLPYSTSTTPNNAVYTTGTITPGTNGAGVEEIFAGETTFTATSEKKIPTDNNQNKVIMRRMVAGLIGYFENVPVWRAGADGVIKKVAQITVEGYATTNSFQFPKFGTGTNKKGGFNGVSSTTDSYEVLLSYDLTTKASNYSDFTTYDPTTDADATYTFAENAAVTTVPDGFKSQENTIFGGRFLVPFSEQFETQNTLLVKLKDQDGNTLKTFKVKNNKTSDTPAYDYGIERNYFYSIGKKLKSGENTPDEPIDLSVENDLEVQLNDAWDVLYDMGLEEE